MAKKKLFEIDEGSEVKSGSLGYMYCTTTPPHPSGMKLGDRKKRYIYLHRAVLEQKLGRYLKQHEQAHHKDENKKNNHHSNIELINRGEHQRQHAIERGLGKYDRAKAKKKRESKKSKKASQSISPMSIVKKFLDL